jgi:NitT/TauT family transport system substrate-binding protein
MAGTIPAMTIHCDRNTLRAWGRIAFVCFAVLAGAPDARAQEHTIRVALARSISSVTTLAAIEKGYFKEHGIRIEIEDIDSSVNAMALLAQNRLQILEGGISAGYFNALEKNLPITIIADRVTTPIHHKLMLRTDLKDEIREIAQLKGRTIASNGQGAVTTYEIGKLLETAGLTMKDVEVKILPFTQMGLAFANKAIDAGLVISPWNTQIADQGLAIPFADPDDYVQPGPLTIAVAFVNTDWEKQNPELLRNYTLGYMRGVRDYCQAYHGGANRQDLIDLLIRSGTERRPEMLQRYPWPARNANGRLSVESLLDMQAWFAKAGLTQQQFPAERLVNYAYVDHAVAKLGPFAVENTASPLGGCR